MPEERTTSSTGGQKGVKLARFDLIPAGPLQRLAEHFGKGARKYAEHNWRKGYEWSKSYSAMIRHQNEFWAGRDYDVCSNDPAGCAIKTDDGHVVEYNYLDAQFSYEDDILIQLQVQGFRFKPEYHYERNTCYNHTGSHHLDAVMWQAFVLREFVETHKNFDDRYIPENHPSDFQIFEKISHHTMTDVPLAHFHMDETGRVRRLNPTWREDADGTWSAAPGNFTDTTDKD